MTWRHQVILSEAEKSAFSAAAAFLEGRLKSRETIDWALRLSPRDHVERLALLAVLDRTSKELPALWLSAWRTIEEFWDQSPDERSSTEAYRIKQRLADGDRSGALISKIAVLLAPRLKVTAHSDGSFRARQIPAKPRNIQHLFSAGLTSNELVAPSLWALATFDDAAFLSALARSLDSSLVAALDLAKRLGWDGATKLWSLGDVRRVYHADKPGEQRSDPDQHGRGIAPCIKMLHAAVARLAQIEPSEGISFMRRWNEDPSPIYLRLWAALACSDRLASSNQVESFLAKTDPAQFWDLHRFPEVAELRARRFADLSEEAQANISARLKAGPPRSRWRHEQDRQRVEQARRYWSVREFRRIEAGGGQLPVGQRAWIEEHQGEFLDLGLPMAITEGFLGGVEVRSHSPTPDNRYDALTGDARLRALQAGLTSARAHWDDDPAESARAWIQKHENALLLLSDLEAAPASGSAFPAVWEAFGWSHSPENPPINTLPRPERSVSGEGGRVIALLEGLSNEAIAGAIGGISYWLSAWEKVIVSSGAALSVWRKIWPIAVIATNAEQTPETEFDLSTVARGPDTEEPMDLDTLNTPAGRLVGVFIAAWVAAKGKRPFAAGSKPRIMRDIIIETKGRAGLIAKHRMIELLAFFQAATPGWTKTHLLPPLLSGGPEAAPLWRALARRPIRANLIHLLGEEILKRTSDPTLGRDTRKSLVFYIVVACLHALYSKRDQPVPLARLQQVLRSLDDEVRANAAEAIRRYVRDNTEGTPEQYFQEAAAPFLKIVWPQERSLSTPGISQALADLPAAAGEAFAEAVDAIERFLVPFDCWTLLEFGLYGEDDAGQRTLSSIDNPDKARALLTLLDRTVGAADGAVIPYGLAGALAQIKSVAPPLEATQEFRRLATAAR